MLDPTTHAGQPLSTFVLTPRAKLDLFEVWSYIAENNIEAANRVESSIFDACVFAAKNPFMGHARPDLTSRPIRFWTVTRYLNYAIVYRPETSPLEVIAVLHGKRNIRRILRQRQ
jgi:plasmid stabilization system protein ParE